MNDDELVHHVKAQWGLPTRRMITVPLDSLVRFCDLSKKTVGYGLGVSSMLGETGRTMRNEFDRLERQMNYELTDILQ